MPPPPPPAVSARRQPAGGSKAEAHRAHQRSACCLVAEATAGVLLETAPCMTARTTVVLAVRRRRPNCQLQSHLCHHGPTPSPGDRPSQKSTRRAGSGEPTPRPSTVCHSRPDRDAVRPRAELPASPIRKTAANAKLRGRQVSGPSRVLRVWAMLRINRVRSQRVPKLGAETCCAAVASKPCLADGSAAGSRRRR